MSDEKISFIPVGIDHNLFNPKVNGKQIRKSLGLSHKKVYLYFGRPGVSRGVKYLIKAAYFIKAKIRNSKLLLILSKEPKGEYMKISRMIKELGLKDHIILLESKPRRELPNYIAASDLVVVPSLTEGFGFTAAEASAMGKAVVATYAGSLPEVIRNKESGILVRPGSEKEIANAVCFLFKNSRLRRKMGRAGASLMEKLSWDETINSLIKLYANK